MRKLFGLVLSLSFTACHQPVAFMEQTTPSLQKVQTEEPVTPPEDPSYQYKQGECATDDSTKIVSCMNCPVPKVVPPPQLSRKGEELLTVMSLGCAIKNKTDPSGYKAPSRAELLARLQQCSPRLYPDTTFKGQQEASIGALVGHDPWARQRIFSGVFYKKPHAEDFATYFGLEVVEARFLFCYDQGHLNGAVYPEEYYQSDDRTSFVMPPLYVEANRIRQNLIRCMDESIRRPYEAPPVPTSRCFYESAEGPFGPVLTEKVTAWLQRGLRVGFESARLGLCGQVDGVDQLPEAPDLKVGGYFCQTQ